MTRACCKLRERAAIQGAIHTIGEGSIYTSEVEREMKLKTIQKNMDQVVNSTAKVNTLYAEVENNGDVQVHDAITKELSELWKSQEVLTRAIKKRQEELDHASEQSETMINRYTTSEFIHRRNVPNCERDKK